VKRTQRVAHLFQQGGVFALGGAAGDDLIAVGVKAAQAGEENLPLPCTTALPVMSLASWYNWLPRLNAKDWPLVERFLAQSALNPRTLCFGGIAE